MPRLTRELIVTATADLLRSEPHAPITMARVAEAVGASPMSLYRHFRDRDDLLLAVTRHVLARHASALPENATWEQELRAWMHANYEQAMAYPQLMHLSLAGDAPIWLSDAAELARILERAGVPPAAIPKALYWVATTTLGHCLVTAGASADVSASRLYAGLAELPDAEATRLAAILPDLPRVSDEAFEIAIDMTIASVGHFIPRRRRS